MNTSNSFVHEKRDEPENGTRVWYRAYKIDYRKPLWTVYSRAGKFMFSGNHLGGCKAWIDAMIYGQFR